MTRKAKVHVTRGKRIFISVDSSDEMTKEESFE